MRDPLKNREVPHTEECVKVKRKTEETEVYREDAAQQSLDILGFSVQPLWLMTFHVQLKEAELTSEPQRSSPSVAEFPAGFPLIPELGTLSFVLTSAAAQPPPCISLEPVDGQRFGTSNSKFLTSLLWNEQSTEFPCPHRQAWTPRNWSLTAKSSPMVSYCRWIFSARSSKSLTMDGFSKDMALLSPEETIAGQVCAMQSQSCRLAKHTPLWFPRRQYKAPCGMENGVWEG